MRTGGPDGAAPAGVARTSSSRAAIKRIMDPPR
jgi:hypothetical protein